MNERDSRLRYPLILLGMLALLAAMWGGLLRMGWQWPALQPALPMAHGPLMVSGFLGTVIGLERAVALGRGWSYAGPLLSAIGAAMLVAGLPGPVGPLLITLSSLGLTAVFAVIVRRQPALFTFTMALGALAWLVGNGLWLAGRPIPQVVMWWAAFLLLTIAGERLELARVLRPTQASLTGFIGVTGLFLLGVVMSSIILRLGVRVAGLGMIGMAGWLLSQDIARRTVRKPGLTRFIAVCLLAGYVWLAAGGAMALVLGGTAGGPRYDAMLHALFLGYVFSMIFGHAPIILPAILRAPLVYDATFYGPLLALHVSLLVRVAGDLGGWLTVRQWGGLLNAVALLLFIMNTARVVRRSVRGAKATGRAIAERSAPTSK